MVQPSTSPGLAFIRSASLSTMASICCRPVCSFASPPAAGSAVAVPATGAPSRSSEGEPVCQ